MCISHFLYIFSQSLHAYNVKFPQATFYHDGGHTHNTMNFSFTFYTWIQSPRIQFQENSPTFDIFSELELGLLTKFEKKQHLFNNVTFLLLLPSSLPKLYLYFDKSLIYRIFFKRYFYLPWFSKLSWIHLLNGIILKVLQVDLVPVPRTCF